MMLSHWPCFTWKFFMIRFHRILKLIFQKQSICPRNIYIELWGKLPNLRAFFKIFFYLKNNDFAEHVQKVLLIVLAIYFQGKIKIFTRHLVDLALLNFYFDLAPLFYFQIWNRCFSACENVPNSSCHFWKHKSVFLKILHQSSVPSNITPLYLYTLYLSNIIYFGQKQPIKVHIFEIFECLRQNS